jgi:peptidyl-prolyl cis-trans isomerase D
MLQSIRAHTQGWLAWALIAVLASVFILWGISGELISNPGEKAVAKVAGQDITEAELQTVYERLAQQNQMAQIMAGITAPVTNEARIRKQALESLIMEHVLTHAAQSQGFLVTTDQVDNILVQLPQFQVNGEFSAPLYERIIRQMNFTPQAFRDTVQKEMMITQAQSAFRDSVFLLPYQLDEAIALVNQSRDIQYLVFKGDSFANQINLTPEDLEAYYNGHHSEFMTDEIVKVAYLELSKKDVAQKVKQNEHPTSEQLHAYYTDNIARFSSPELRSAKHILIAVKPDASQADRDAAQAKAQALLEQLKSGASFADLAKKNSDDPGSATLGGDLGSFGHGEMVPEFDKAVFEGKTGELVGPVKTDFGYHIILVGNIVPAAVKPFDQVKDTITQEWLADKVVDQYDKDLSEMDQLAFENTDSLDKVAQTFNLPIQNLTLYANPEKNSDLAKNAQIHAAAFSDEVLVSRQNSEVIRVSPDKVVVLRVVEHQTPVLKSFDSVKDELKTLMHQRQGILLAREKANSILEAYNKGESLEQISQKEGVTWHAVKNLTRQNTQELSPEILKAAFTLPPQQKPAMSGVEVADQGTALVLLEAVHPGKLDAQFPQAMIAEFSDSLSQFKGARDFNLYVTQAKKAADVKEQD